MTKPMMERSLSNNPPKKLNIERIMARPIISRVASAKS
jgi:hypothetical protein